MRRPDPRRLAIIAAVVVVGWLTATASVAAGPYDPALRFRSLTTPHFVIHFHQGEEALAGRLAVEAELIHDRLAIELGRDLSGRTHVVLRDQSDQPNGFAAVLPYNTIVIDVVPPVGADFIGNTDDWLRDVFTHEYVHILHLDRSRGWARLARALFGRSAVAYPNLSLPLWQIEGLATLLESGAGRGRIRSGTFRTIVDTAAAAHVFEPLDRVNGGLVDWPAGHGWYAYGALFHEFLADRYGAASLARLADRTAGRLHFFTSAAFRQEYGASLGELWREFEDERRRRGGVANDGPGRRLTALGFQVSGLRGDADGGLLFTAADPNGFPGIYRLAPGATTPERLRDRFGGSGLAVTHEALVFDQLELVRNVALHSDLYLYDRRSGRTRRLTREARLLDPELSSDGTRLAAVRVVPGGRELVVLDARALLDASAPVTAEALPILTTVGPAGAVHAAPRWSPDGRWIAVERGPAPQRIVLVDTRRDGVVAVVGAPGRSLTPSWAPDGDLLFAVERGDSAPSIHRATLDPDGGVTSLREVARAAGGLHWPLALGRGTIVAARYGPAGFDVWAVPSTAHTVRSSVPPTSDSAQPAVSTASRGVPYSPWRTLAPRGWVPLVDYRDDRWWAGAAVTGVDVLARHVVSAQAAWAVAGGGASADLVSRGRPDWSASYVYQRWRPSFYGAARDRTSLFSAVTGSGDLVPVAQRERQLDAGVVLPVRRVRWAQAARVAYHLERVTTRVTDDEAVTRRAGFRLGWSVSTARRYGYSVSLEDGYRGAVNAELFSPSLGSDGRADAFSGDGRFYWRLARSHVVVAGRAAMAASTGDDGFRRVYRLGGADGNPNPGAFGSDALSLLRGFGDGVFAGTRVGIVNAELRLPLWRPQRGLGTWPAFVRAIHLAGILDLGNAWSDDFRWADRKLGVGAELSADVVVGFGLPLTWTVGVAAGRDGAGLVADDTAVYVRVGPSF